MAPRKRPTVKREVGTLRDQIKAYAAQFHLHPRFRMQSVPGRPAVDVIDTVTGRSARVALFALRSVVDTLNALAVEACPHCGVEVPVLSAHLADCVVAEHAHENMEDAVHSTFDRGNGSMQDAYNCRLCGELLQVG